MIVIYSSLGKALVDLLTRNGEKIPDVGSRILCRHPVLEQKRAWVSPSKIENLHKVYWKDGKVLNTFCYPVEKSWNWFLTVVTLD